MAPRPAANPKRRAEQEETPVKKARVVHASGPSENDEGAAIGDGQDADLEGGCGGTPPGMLVGAVDGGASAVRAGTNESGVEREVEREASTEESTGNAAGDADGADVGALPSVTAATTGAANFGAGDLPDDLDVTGMDLALQRRVAAMRAEASIARGYYVTNLPEGMAYGTKTNYVDMRNFLVGENNNAVKVYLLGRVNKFEFLDVRTGDPPVRPYVIVNLVTEKDQEAVVKLFNEHSLPEGSMTKDLYRTVIAGRFMKKFDSDASAKPSLFKEVYDASGGMRTRVQIACDRLLKGDLVVLELTMRRRVEAPRGRDEGEPTQYFLGFQLSAINVLLHADGADQVDW